MTWIVIRSVVWGIAGLVGVPILTFVLILALAYLFDSRCGTPGDSGGCEMGSMTAGLAMSLPGFALGFFLSLILGLRKRRLSGRSTG
jgi:hypothetical protein